MSRAKIRSKGHLSDLPRSFSIKVAHPAPSFSLSSIQLKMRVRSPFYGCRKDGPMLGIRCNEFHFMACDDALCEPGDDTIIEWAEDWAPPDLQLTPSAAGSNDSSTIVMRDTAELVEVVYVESRQYTDKLKTQIDARNPPTEREGNDRNDETASRLETIPIVDPVPESTHYQTFLQESVKPPSPVANPTCSPDEDDANEKNLAPTPSTHKDEETPSNEAVERNGTNKSDAKELDKKSKSTIVEKSDTNTSDAKGLNMKSKSTIVGKDETKPFHAKGPNKKSNIDKKNIKTPHAKGLNKKSNAIIVEKDETKTICTKMSVAKGLNKKTKSMKQSVSPVAKATFCSSQSVCKCNFSSAASRTTGMTQWTVRTTGMKKRGRLSNGTTKEVKDSRDDDAKIPLNIDVRDAGS